MSGLSRRSTARFRWRSHFKDETGRDVALGDYFHGKPVLLALVYYGCPMLCNQVEQGVVGSLKMLSFNPGHRLRSRFRQLRFSRIGRHGRAEENGGVSDTFSARKPRRAGTS